MNTLADRYYRDTHYPIPHADFLRLQHAHATGVLFLDLLDTLDLGGQRPDAVQQASFASVIALLTDQLGHVVNTCETQILARMEAMDTCAFYRVSLGYTLDELQMTIALRLEGHFVRQYGAEDGMDMACTMLSDMVQPDVLVAAPRLTALGQKMMDELCCERLSASQNATVH